MGPLGKLWSMCAISRLRQPMSIAQRFREFGIRSVFQKLFVLALVIVTFCPALAAQNSETLGELARRAREAKAKRATANTTITNDSAAPPSSVPAAAPSNVPKSDEPRNYDLKKVPKEWRNCTAAVAGINNEEDAYTDVHLDASFSGNSFQSNGLWTYDGRITLKRSITVILPDWVNIPNDAAIRAAWQSAYDGLRKHEEGHVRIAMENSLRLDNASVTGTGSSAIAAQQQASQQFNQILQSVRSTHVSSQQQYDAQTDHGRKQSVVGGTDIKLNCP
jgi:hypothetical protein